MEKLTSFKTMDGNIFNCKKSTENHIWLSIEKILRDAGTNAGLHILYFENKKFTEYLIENPKIIRSLYNWTQELENLKNIDKNNDDD